MSALRTWSNSEKIGREKGAGDTLITNRNITANATVGASTLSASSLVQGIIRRTLSGGALDDTTATGPLIMNALLSNTGNGPSVGESFECTYANATGSIMTIVGGTGVTVAGTAAVPVAATVTLHFQCTAVGTNTLANGVYTNVGATFTCTVF